MKKVLRYLIIIISLFLSTGHIGFSQTKIDRVYVEDIYAEKNTTKGKASYYRVRTISNGILKAEDYNIQDSSIECSAYYKSFDPYVKHGHCIFYSDDSIVSSEGNFEEDEKTGVWKNYYSSGELWYTDVYTVGVRNDSLQGFYKTGEVKRIETYKEGKRVTGQCYTKSGADTAYYEMYIFASFPEGDKARQDYFINTIKYPAKAQRDKIEGIVYVSFVVNKDGSISDVKIMNGRGVNPLLDDEAIRCVKNMPRWTPGYIDGDPVKIRMIQKIKFTLK